MTFSHKAFLATLRKSGISLREDPAVPTACVHITQNKYEIILGKAYTTGTPAQKRTLLCHELGHIVRGDLRRKGLDPESLVIAADACINDALDHAIVKELSLITYEFLRQKFPELPPTLPTWRTIYNILQKHKGTLNIAPPDTLKPGEISDAGHAKIVLGIREDMQKIFPELAKQCKIANAGPSTSNPERKIPSVPLPAPAVTEILSRLNALGISGNAIQSRSYSRPGRVSGLRGHIRAHMLLVSIGIDASGSTQSLLPILIGAAEWLSTEKIEVELWAWATDATRIYDLHTIPDSIGFGTQVQSLYRKISPATTDALIILTDGEIVDAAPTWPGPIIWVGPDAIKELPGEHVVIPI